MEVDKERTEVFNLRGALQDWSESLNLRGEDARMLTSSGTTAMTLTSSRKLSNSDFAIFLSSKARSRCLPSFSSE